MRQPAWLHEGQIMPDQSGALLRVTAWMNKGRATDVVCLDTCNAFDIILNRILISKMERYGFVGWMIQQTVTARGLRSLALSPGGGQREVLPHKPVLELTLFNI